MAKIIVLGSINVDMTGYTSRFPLPGQTVMGQAFQMGPGGKGNNQATAAAKTGSEVIFISAVGDDFLAEVALNHLQSAGIDDRFVSRKEGVATGCAVIEVETDSGENRIIVVKGANGLISPEDVSATADEFPSAALVLSQLETELSPILRAKELAHKAKIPFILNPAPYQPVPPELLQGLDYITPNETEAADLTGISISSEEDAKKAARQLQQMGVRNVIITLGKKGAFFLGEDGQSCLVPACPVHAVNTTGAGDAFNGGFCTALAEGNPPEAALAFAAKVAAISVTREGAATSMPTRQEVDSFSL